MVQNIIKYLTSILAILLISTSAYSANPADSKVAGFAGAEYWRVVQQGDEGRTQVEGEEAGQLINISGETWKYWRNEWVTPAGAIAISGTLAILLIFYLIVGQKKLDQPRTGVKIERWKRLDRANHWTVAVLFLILGFSGLNILYGKFFLKDVMGDGLWASYIMLCKQLHNYLGPIFVVFLLFMIVRWIKHNFFNKTDLIWFIKGGGIIGNAHPSAGYLNGGEKVWFWMITFFGIAVSVSGLILDFPNFGQFRETMQWANLIHAGASIILLAASFGHIYIGTVGTEGAFEGMKTGYVDETWAKQHHDLWYEEEMEKQNK